MTSKLDPQEMERLAQVARRRHSIELANTPYGVMEFGQIARALTTIADKLRTGQLVPAMPSGDVVEAVARAIYDAEDSQSGDHVGTVIYNSEHLFAEVRDGETEVDATKRTAMQVCRDAARAAITTYEAVSGVAKMREALECADTLRKAIRDAGIKRTPGIYEAVMRFDAARAALGEKP